MPIAAHQQSLVLTFANGDPVLLHNLIAGSGTIDWVEITAFPTNTNPIYHGGQMITAGNATLSATNFGGYIPAPTASVPVAPYRYDGKSARLDDVQVCGTTGEKVCLNVRVLL